MSQGVANETVASLKSKLNAWGVAIPPRAKKADLVALFLANQNRSNLPTHPPSVRTQDEALSLKSLFRLIPVSIQAFALLGVFQIIFMTMHLAFSTMRSTTPTSTFVPRHDYSRAIDDFIETSNSRYMVVIGPRGCGKVRVTHLISYYYRILPNFPFPSHLLFPLHYQIDMESFRGNLEGKLHVMPSSNLFIGYLGFHLILFRFLRATSRLLDNYCVGQRTGTLRTMRVGDLSSLQRLCVEYLIMQFVRLRQL